MSRLTKFLTGVSFILVGAVLSSLLNTEFPLLFLGVIGGWMCLFSLMGWIYGSKEKK